MEKRCVHEWREHNVVFALLGIFLFPVLLAIGVQSHWIPQTSDLGLGFVVAFGGLYLAFYGPMFLAGVIQKNMGMVRPCGSTECKESIRRLVEIDEECRFIR